jgi:hypothetical protein
MHSSVGTAMGCKAVVRLPAEANLFSTASRLALQPTQPPVQWVLGLFPRSKAAEA